MSDYPHREEAAPVKEAFMEMKRSEGLTQEKLAGMCSVTQGLVGKWLSGAKRIPDHTLLTLGTILGFNPFEARPELLDLIRLGNIALRKEDRNDIEELTSQLTESEALQAEAYLRFLLSSRKEQ